MCDNRRYTPAAIQEMQTIALAVELRKCIERYRKLLNPLTSDELTQADYSQCDNPPEAATLADYTAGMME